MGTTSAKPTSTSSPKASAAALGAQEKKRTGPNFADILHQRFVAVMDEVQIGEVKLVEFGDEVAIESPASSPSTRPPLAFRGEIRKPVRSGPISVGHGGCHFDGKAGPVGDRTTVFVGAQVGVGREELVYQIAIRAVDLDTVSTGFNGALGGISGNPAPSL